jgi:hypothetical protein
MIADRAAGLPRRALVIRRQRDVALDHQAVLPGEQVLVGDARVHPEQQAERVDVDRVGRRRRRLLVHDLRRTDVGQILG